MSSLTFTEKRIFEALFDMKSGYVMSSEIFSDRTFADFFQSIAQIDINASKYGQQSKARRLRAFWAEEPDTTVGKVMQEMLGIWLGNQPDKSSAAQDYNYLEGQKAVARLIGKTAEPAAPTEDDLLSRDFSRIDLSILNLEAALEPVLAYRLKEIRICLAKEAPLAAIILAGSMLEGLLLNAAIRDPQKFNQSSASPKDKKTGDVLKFQDWTLGALIDAAHDIGLLGLDVKKHGHSLRDFRNFIHPYQQMYAQFTPDAHTAKIGLQVLLAVIADIGGQRRRAA